METYHIHINGVVQGVGFRPMVYLLASEMGLNGYVKNGGDGVHVFFNAPEPEAECFLQKIKVSAPAKAKIISIELKKVTETKFSGFKIVVEDSYASEKKVLISPDTAVCSLCQAELLDVNNGRYRYPFITCTNCGPRYSILNSLPYERENTAMQKFIPCKSCNEEYYNTADRRFFSQTNSCTNCGIGLSIYENESSILSNNTRDVLLRIKDFLCRGKIVAIKGIGGYLLLCDASNSQTIQLLRNRKHRPAKPFAVLFPDIETVQNEFELNKKEEELLQSAEAPIVLLRPKKSVLNSIAITNIAPHLNKVGVMLPYSPLLLLVSHDFGKPLIATSANVSGSPIIYTDDDALFYLFSIADYVVTYNRDIVVPQDDSVVQVSQYSNQMVILRRSRGYAPTFLDYKPNSRNCVLATGAFLKSTFSLAVNGNVLISQFLGSGEAFESQLMYKRTLAHWLKLYDTEPRVIIADLHPGYFTHQYATELAEEYKADLQLVQHHEAHFAAVLAENDLIKSKEPVLGIIWDGTGLGHDGNIWGGEFFKYEHNRMSRCCHFDYFPVIAGDKMALEPRVSALCATANLSPPPEILRQKFTEVEWNNYQSLIKATKIFTSSVGRIFDSVASLLNICDKQSYEGEAAMYLQALAEDYVNINSFEMDEGYFIESPQYDHISITFLMLGIMADINKGKTKNYIAAKLHYSLVCLVGMVATAGNIKNICFSGGVMQNTLLVDWLKHQYMGKYQLYFHKNISPNDENISFGQLAYYENGISSLSNEGQKGRNHQSETVAYI